MAINVSNIGLDITPEGHELYPHGTVEFPLACYDMEFDQDGFPWHWHDEWEMVYISKGQLEFTAGAKKYTIREGEGIIINGGVLHSGAGYNDRPSHLRSLVFHPRLVGGSVDSIYWQKYVDPLVRNRNFREIYLDGSEEWHGQVLKLLKEAWKYCAADEEGYEIYVREKLSRLVLLLKEHVSTKQTRISEKSLRNTMRVKQMLQYINEHYWEDFTVKDIAEYAGVSESECLRCFRNMVGMPPVKYVRQYRLQIASELLATTDLKITEIAEKCGFSDSSYFTKSFREWRGIAPGEYRKVSV